MLSSRQELPPINLPTIKSRSLGKEMRKSKIGAYIKQTLQHINNGCYQDGKLCLDGGYGDYRMSIFRLKDRKKRINEIPSMFNETFATNMSTLTPELRQEFNKIIKTNNEEYLPRKSETIDNEEGKPRLGEWRREEEGFLYHDYVPNYRKDKWFKKVTPYVEPMAKSEEVVVIQAPKAVRKKKIVKKERTHFFSYLQSNSMVFANSS